jgi:hypothetical protein
MATEQAAAPKPHWNDLTPGRLLTVLLAVELILLLSEQWYPKGWAAVIATASVAAVTVYLLYRFVSAFLSDRPFQYSILSLLIFTAMIAVTIGWMTRNLQQAARQKKALGPWCQDKGEFVGHPAPAWLCAMLGDDFFWDVSGKHNLDFYDESNTTDADYIADDFANNSEQTPLCVMQASLTEVFCEVNKEIVSHVDAILAKAMALGKPANGIAAPGHCFGTSHRGIPRWLPTTMVGTVLRNA